MNCKKSLWLYKHKKEEQKFSEATMAIFKHGTDVGEFAQQYCPNGKMAVLEDYPGYASAERTKKFIEQGVETIYEATFIYDNTLVAVDILHKEKGKWKLYEVKSTNSTKEAHILDVAIQYYVVTGCGVELEDAGVLHFNREYVRRGELEVEKLFKFTGLKEKVLTLQNEIKENIPLLLKTLQGEEPAIEMGLHCEKPYTCDFTDYCRQLLPEEIKEEIRILSSEPEIAEYEVRDYVSIIKYPIGFLDFETINPGIPMFDESRPYQKIPFQYSIHFMNSENDEPKHYQYLAPSCPNTDPRIGLIENMIKDLENSKTIFVYNIAFEKGCINDLIRDFPQYEYDLTVIKEKLVDLIIPFRRKYYRTETMQGSSSLKKVLPALCPELSYSELDIGDGLTAGNEFFGLYFCDKEEIKKKTREDLLKYCHLDTLAMVRIFEVLKQV